MQLKCERAVCVLRFSPWGGSSVYLCLWHLTAGLQIAEHLTVSKRAVKRKRTAENKRMHVYALSTALGFQSGLGLREVSGVGFIIFFKILFVLLLYNER